MEHVGKEIWLLSQGNWYLSWELKNIMKQKKRLVTENSQNKTSKTMSTGIDEVRVLWERSGNVKTERFLKHNSSTKKNKIFFIISKQLKR